VFRLEAAADPVGCGDDRDMRILRMFRLEAAGDPIECDDDRGMGIGGLFVFDAVTVPIEPAMSGRDERVSGSDEA
jgi:hypothetical protein